MADGAACPATAPERGATCTGTPHCSYAGSCGGQPSANAVMATCGADGHWQIAEADCFPAMQCPSAPPHDGDRCFPALHCTYGDCSSGASVVEATCPEGGTFSVTTSHCDAAGPDASVSDGG